MCCTKPAFVHFARFTIGIFPKGWKTLEAGRIATWRDISPITPAYWRRILATGFRSGLHSTCRGHLRISVTAQAFSRKAASPKATVGSAYGMSPAYPKTDSEADRAATARYHAMNNLLFLETAMHGKYPNAFVGEIPYEAMGFRAGDDKIMQVPLDWIGFHYYSRRLVAAAGAAAHSGGGALATETQDTGAAGNDYTQFVSEMPTEGPITDGGLEIWPSGIYDLVMQISREYNFPTIEITESGCGYLDTPYDRDGGHVPDARRIDFFRSELAELARAIKNGAKVRAFHAWSALDNFEWNDGYTQRYGLTYVDFRDQKRTVKDSGLWYGRVAATNKLS